jgi:hypothetical protein
MIPSGITKTNYYLIACADDKGNVTESSEANNCRASANTGSGSATLTVNKAGTGNGTVTGTGINCGTDCAESYIVGTSATLTAVSTGGSTFTGWSGCTNTSGATCYVTMDANMSVTASFGPPCMPSLNGNWTGSANGSYTTGYVTWPTFSFTVSPGTLGPAPQTCGGTLTWTSCTTANYTGTCYLPSGYYFYCTGGRTVSISGVFQTNVDATSITVSGTNQCGETTSALFYR